MSSYIVTGAAGFIGSAVAARLVEGGHSVVTIDNLSTGYESNIPPGVRFIPGNCQDPEVIGKIPRDDYHAIFHIAGQSSGEISFDDPAYDLRTNAESTLNLLRFAVETGCFRIIFASTMSVYGRQPDQPVTENNPTVPESFYAVGKLASEHYLRIYEQFGVQPTSLRLFNVFGPGQNLANLRQGMVSIFIAQLLDSGRIHVKGSGSRFRDFVYIDDVADAFVSCLNHPFSIGRVINIGSGVRVTVEQLVDKLIKEYHGKATAKYSGSTPGDIHGIYADIALAKSLLSYTPKTPLDAGLKGMMDWATAEHTRSAER